MKIYSVCAFLLGGLLVGCSVQPQVGEWVVTTRTDFWQSQSVEQIGSQLADSLVVIDVNQVLQSIEGFGTCFNELGWASLSRLDQPVRDSIFQELFSPQGANFVVNRMPIGANDFSLDWYSYNETDGDFEMRNFSIAHDEQTLIPFIQAAMKVNPDFKLWASPWGPPSWLKTNKHYACSPTRRWNKDKSTAEGWKKEGLQASSNWNDNPLRMRMQPVENGLAEEGRIREGSDGFIQDERYLKAYALYFGKFIDAYKKRGIHISMVMPQNEPNSAQPYPACCWTSQGQINFLKFLGPEMEKRGVDVYLGTIERANPALQDSILTHPEVGSYIKGMGFQWAGKSALPILHQKYPSLPCYQTEQECGNGLNNWEGAMYSWNLMKYYLKHGVTAYLYWNTSLFEGGVSRWGWFQNSLITVNEEDNTYRFTPEYFVMKHVSHYVKPAAKLLKLGGNYQNVLSFVNPDGSVVVIVGNAENCSFDVTIQLEGINYSIPLVANSLQTLLINPA